MVSTESGIEARLMDSENGNLQKNRDNRTEECFQRDVDILREWTHTKYHFAKEIDDDILTAFIHGTKSVDIAKRKLESFLDYRNRVPKLFDFSCRDPTNRKFKEVAKSQKMFVLPKATVEGYTVLHVVADDSSKYDFAPNIIRFSMILELILKHYPKQKGLVIFCDMKDQKKHFWKLHPSYIITLVNWIQKANPVKLKRLVLYNTDYFSDIIVNKMLKPFVPKKMYERVVFTKHDGSFLKNFIEEEKLPSDFGGMEQSSDQLHDNWMNIIENNRDWFEMSSKWFPVESVK